MTTRERIAFYREREDKAFTVKQEMYEAELEVSRKRSRRYRLIEIVALGLLAVLILLFLQPYLQTKWQDVFAYSGERSFVVSAMISLLVVLVGVYFIDLRRHMDSELLADLRTRLMVTQLRQEEADRAWQIHGPKVGENEKEAKEEK